jgi:hypothetical protein
MTPFVSHCASADRRKNHREKRFLGRFRKFEVCRGLGVREKCLLERWRRASSTSWWASRSPVGQQPTQSGKTEGEPRPGSALREHAHISAYTYFTTGSTMRRLEQRAPRMG